MSVMLREGARGRLIGSGLISAVIIAAAGELVLLVLLWLGHLALELWAGHRRRAQEVR
jgi:hypothetical protein